MYHTSKNDKAPPKYRAYLSVYAYLRNWRKWKFTLVSIIPKYSETGTYYNIANTIPFLKMCDADIIHKFISDWSFSILAN